MSYSILYRSMFVKLSDGRYIPMMEMGDNNVWEVGSRRRRVRSWSSINLHKGDKFFTLNDIKKYLDEWNSDYVSKREKDLNSDEEWLRNSAERSNFGFYESVHVYGKSNTTYSDVRNIVLGGVRNSISFSDAVSRCGLHISYWEDGVYRTERLSSEEEMYSIISVKFGGDYNKFYFGYNSGHSTERFYEIRKAIKSLTRAGDKPYKVSVTKKDSDVKYYLKLDDVGFSLTEDISEATNLYRYTYGKTSISDIVFSEFVGIHEMETINQWKR